MTSIKLYSKQNCTQCDQAKVLLQMRGFTPEVLMLDDHYTLEDVKTLAPTQRTFPVVFANDILIGDLNSLKEYLKNF